MVVFLDSGKDNTGSKEKREQGRYQFEDMFSRKYYAEMPEETWISGKFEK